jgi:hypothetical protein
VSVERFDKLVSGRLDESLGREINGAARSLETIQVRNLMELLARVQAS